MFLFVLVIIGFIFAFGVAFLYEYLFRRQEVKRVRNIASDLLQSAIDKENLSKKQAEFKLREKSDQLKQVSHEDVKDLRDKNRKLQSSIDKEKHRNRIDIEDMEGGIKSVEEQLLVFKEELNKRQSKDSNFFEKWAQISKQYVEKLTQHFSLNLETIKKEIEDQELQEAEVEITHYFQKILENTQKDVERKAVKILHQVLNRFPQPYCPERGIKAVVFKDAKSLQMILGPQRKFLNFLEKQCGVDVVVDEKNLFLSIQGLDPVRREWGRLSLSKLSKKNRISQGIISSIVQMSKRELFRKIRKDGQRICNHLKLKNVAMEVCDMMGALRYRYSFAQNQHFHCEEVGWLCGLLANELDMRTEALQMGRRAGLFHDIGKAMDHAHSGGHAMIGADLIEKHGEDARIVRAVRAHHHDVRPHFYLDFLVIAADAISGSRPGARRSTVDSYNQKVLSLEKIGKSFKGVKDIYVMNAGRELRVIVDSKKINDFEALNLSKKVVQRIEEECSYPGWIKVTVVRTVESNQKTQIAAH